MNKVSVLSLSRKFQGLERKVQTVVRRALRELQKQSTRVDVYLISEAGMRELNKRFRKRKMSTNVLSFKEPKDFPHPEAATSYLGEIYLAPDYVRRKKENLEYLLVHGLLHLLGYTHLKKNDRIRMERLEKKLQSDV